jgi:dipeptidyl aminopeptidase/acylaminoacyl peptidase
MKRAFLLAWVLLPISGAAASANDAKRPMAVDDLFRFQRVADPQISPDGRFVVYSLATVNLEENKTSSCLWLAPTNGGTRRQLTNTTKKDRHPRWSPNGKQILFESNRSGENQIWVIDSEMAGEARQLTNITSEASGALWSPDAEWIAFISAVNPEFSNKPFAESNALNKKKKDAAEKNPVKAREFNKLFFRHWDDWVEDKRQHIFVLPATGGEPRDITPGDHDANPTSSTFSVGDDFTYSPDSKWVYFTAPPEHGEAWSTNYDIYRVSVNGGQREPVTHNQAADGAPRFSPDGKLLAYRAQNKPGYEADRWQLMVADVHGGEPRSLTKDFDSSIEDFVWAPSSDHLLFTAQEKARAPIFTVSVSDGQTRKIYEGHTQSGLSICRDGTKLAFSQASLQYPAEACVLDLDPLGSQDRNVSQANTKLLSQLDLSTPESVTVEGAGGVPMQMWTIKPPNFDPAKKWPLVYLVHGGPQGAWEDGWSFRWCPELWAAQGYVIALPNPRGSTGFGQKYVDEISGDWGGKCFDDLMTGVAYMEKQPYIDTDRMAAAGASFGGYMMNWFEGHTNKFKTLICHCGVYNFGSMYATTDELWFDEWEHGGTPWEKGEEYAKFSPHRFAKNFKTPMLIIQNDLDFRCPVGEGLQLFTTLQRLGIPSKMINFPDEGHWVLKPANSAYWHRQVFAWLKKYVAPGSS